MANGVGRSQRRQYIGMLALVRVVVLKQKIAVAVLDDRLRVGLNLRHHAQDFGDLDVERRLGAVEDVAVGVGRFVAVVHPLGAGANLAVVAGDELEEAQNAACWTRRANWPQAGPFCLPLADRP